MSRITKAKREEAREQLREALCECGLLERRPGSSGVTEYCEIRLVEPGNDGPRPTLWLTRRVSVALGYRFNEKREAISMGGYGYCRATQIASDLHKLCGHPIRVEALNYFAGLRGWYPKAPVEQ